MKKDEQVVFEFENKEINVDGFATETETANVTVKTETPKKDSKKCKSTLFIAIGAVVLVIAMVIMVVVLKERRDNTIVINKDMLMMDFYGYDGLGICHGTIYYREVEKTLERFLEERSDDIQIDDFGNLYSRFYLIINKTDNLSNGDMIEVEVIPDKNFFKEHGIYIDNAKFTIKVTGLKSLESYEPFDKIVLYKVNGKDGDSYYARREIGSIDPLQAQDFDCSYIENIDGGFINVRIKEDAIERLASMGVEIEETEHNFSIDEVRFLCVSDYEELPQDVYRLYINEGDNVIKLLYEEYLEFVGLKDVEYYGGWIVTYDNAEKFNRLVGIYKIEVAFKQEGIEPVTLYVRCEDVNVTVSLSEGYIDARGVFQPINPVFYDAVIDKKKYEIHGTENISDLFEKGDYSTVVFDPNGNLQSFE